MYLQKYNIRQTNSWEELGEAGEQRVLTAVPKGFFYFRNILVPCIHDNDFEEIDLAVVGPTGIWSIEVKNWRGIAYLGNHPEELTFIRNTSDGARTSTRDNPYYQAHRHSEDLHDYLAKRLKGWFPTIHTIVVIASKDWDGVNGVNLNRIRHTNPNIIYLEEMGNLLEDPSKKIQAWKGWYEVRDALSKLRTWDVIHFTNGERKRGLLCRWESYDRFKIRDGAQTILIDWGGISRMEIVHKDQSRIFARFVFHSGDIQTGELVDNAIPVYFLQDRIKWIKLAEIAEIYTGHPCAR